MEFPFKTFNSVVSEMTNRTADERCETISMKWLAKSNVVTTHQSSHHTLQFTQIMKCSMPVAWARECEGARKTVWHSFVQSFLSVQTTCCEYISHLNQMQCKICEFCVVSDFGLILWTLSYSKNRTCEMLAFHSWHSAYKYFQRTCAPSYHCTAHKCTRC